MNNEHKKRIEDFANESCACEESFADIITYVTYGYSLAAEEKDTEIEALKIDLAKTKRLAERQAMRIKESEQATLQNAATVLSLDKENAALEADFFLGLKDISMLSDKVSSLESALKVAEEALESVIAICIRPNDVSGSHMYDEGLKTLQTIRSIRGEDK